MSRRISGDKLAGIELAFCELVVGGLAVSEPVASELMRR